MSLADSFNNVMLIETLYRPQITAYFDRINPMMPVISRMDLLDRLSDDTWLGDRSNRALLFVTTALALVHPLTYEERVQKAAREKQAMMLMNQACQLVAAWDYGCTGSVEKVLTSFLMFGILHELGQSWGARLRLRDAITMGEAMGLHDETIYIGLDSREATRRLNLLYILALTERYVELIGPSMLS
jgi:hypothetical protein